MQTLAVICLGMTIVPFAGCGNDGSDKLTHLEGAFGYRTHVKGSVHGTVSINLEYQDPTGKHQVVWPYLQTVWGRNTQVNSNTALFIGGKAQVYEDGKERLARRLMAFEGPKGPPMDLTDQILTRWCSENRVALTNVMEGSFVALTETNDAVKIDFSFLKLGERGPGTVNARGTSMTVSWNEIEAIIEDIRNTGKLRREKWSGTEYLQKE